MLSASARTTQSIAKKLACELAPGAVVGLVGPLGAGKTTFVQGLARALGVSGRVASPTYTLVNEYSCAQGTFIHLDFYRLESVESAIALGIPEVLARPDAIVVVEWADHLEELLPPHTVWVELRVEKNQRHISVARTNRGALS